ncbi:MAG: TPM domain-containing protein [Bacteroidetes bacterium CHB5]|nr:TPM domain-containing protein [Bacteroidetes bacterium CHB5]
MRFTFIFFLFVSGWAVAQKPVPELWGTRVHDDARVLKQETVEALESQLKAYEDSTSNQIAILTISSLEGEVIEEYSLRVAEKWKLGQKDKDNGVLLLIAVDDHKMRIEVGHGLEGVLTDAQCNRIIRNEMAPAFRRADFDGGIIAAVNGIVAAIGGEYSADDSGDLIELSTTTRILIGLGIYAFLGIFAFFGLFIKGGWGWFMYLFLTPFFSIFPAFVFPLHLWYVPGVSYLVGFPIIKWLVNRTPWGKRLAKKFGEGGGSGSGGSWRSGSSWSSGSSSWSSGGSSFSGGGGSFGGGGSSGSW